MTVPMVVSNHPDLHDDVEQFGIPFFHVPVESGNKAAAEKEQLKLLKGNVDLLVLARYMQILSGDFLTSWRFPSSTSTTRSYRPSSVRIPTSGPRSAASS